MRAHKLGYTTRLAASAALLLLATGGCAATNDRHGPAADDAADSGFGANAEGSGSTDDFGGSGSKGSGNAGSTGSCVEVSESAENKPQPSDIIVAIDQSGSMDEETEWVKNQLNGFAQQITSSGIDVRVVVIAGKPGSENGFCVPAPLGSGSCPADDQLPELLHVNQHVDSHDALMQILSRYPDYSAQLRPDAAKHIVVISDDDAHYVTAPVFDSQILQLDPPMFDNYVFHTITPSDDDCPDAADEGSQYILLAAATGGVFGDLCMQNFQPVWDAVSTQVISQASLACSWQIPAPPDGEQVDTAQVNVDLSLHGASLPLGYVDGAQACASVSGGWYYDDPSAPSEVHVCPDVCSQVQGADSASVSIGFGCATVQAPLK
jgi:hypothetical protein